MTQRVDLATVMDRLTLDALVTDYAVAVDDGDWEGYLALFAADGVVDYRSAGGTEGSARETARWLAETLTLFPMRQHLIVNRRIRFDLLDGDVGDTAAVRADYFNPMRTNTPRSAPDFECGGRYEMNAVREAAGWRLRRVAVHEKWRRVDMAPTAD